MAITSASMSTASLDQQYVQWSYPAVTPTLPKTRQQLEVERARIDRQLTAFDQYGDDDYEFGCALAFVKTFGDGKSYEYIVLKAPNGRWYPTGNIRRDMSWSELVEFMSEGRPVTALFMVSGYERVEL